MQAKRSLVRKCVFIAVCFLLVALSLPARAQLKFGVKAGFNMSKLSLSDVEARIADDNRKSDFFAGPTMEVMFPIVGLGVDMALLYDRRSLQLESESDMRNESLDYLDVPLNLKYVFGMGSQLGFFISTGPQVSYNIGNKTLFEYFGDGDFELSRTEFSWNIGGGVRLLKHLQLAYNYNVVLGEYAEMQSVSRAKEIYKGKFSNGMHQVSLAIMF